MEGAEQRQLPYLFKLKQSLHVKKLINRLFGHDRWMDAGQHWQGLGTELTFEWLEDAAAGDRIAAGVTRQRTKGSNLQRKASQQLNLDLLKETYQGIRYEYAVLVTSLKGDVRTIAQHYRDRCDSGNNFDKLKNQMGMGRIQYTGSKAVPGDGAHYRASALTKTYPLVLARSYPHSGQD